MTILGACECCLGGPLVLIGLLTALRLGWLAHHRPAPPAPINRDVLAPHAPLYGARRLETRTIPPLETWPENPMRDTLVIARPARLWWDTTERKDW